MVGEINDRRGFDTLQMIVTFRDSVRDAARQTCALNMKYGAMLMKRRSTNIFGTFEKFQKLEDNQSSLSGDIGKISPHVSMIPKYRGGYFPVLQIPQNLAALRGKNLRSQNTRGEYY